MKALVLCFLGLLLSGCAMRPEFVHVAPDDARFEPVDVVYTPQKKTDGSLYTVDSAITLFEDKKAYRVGDILTVTLDESTQSSKKAKTAFDKSSSTAFTAPLFGTKSIRDAGIEASAERDFSGSATSSQGNNLSGSISVTVYKVLSNNNLLVRGEKWLRLNQGDEFIRLSGRVRSEDVSNENTIASQRIADARITYSGQGTFADSNSAGWLSQLFNSAWMPF